METQNYRTITQEHGQDGLSGKYGFIPTSRVLGVLEQSGWLPSTIKESSTRGEKNKGFQTHVVRLSNRDLMSDGGNVGEERAEIVLYNNHMGTSTFRLMCGVFRLVCSNGLVVGNNYAEHRIRHIGYTDEAVRAAIEHIVDVTPRIYGEVNSFKGIELNRDEQEAYAQSAIELRFDGEKYAVDPRSLLNRRRYADGGKDLWTTFNAVQENLIKGGVRQVDKNNRRSRARGVTSIDKSIELNKALWTLTSKMAELKGVSVSA